MSKLKRRIMKFDLNPPRVLALGFFGLIIMGTLLLSLPIATKSGVSTRLIDSLFTAASAVCVTGLVVVNTSEYWSLFGQVVILLLIQIGGLGIMTMATIFALISGKRIRIKERLIIKEQLNQETLTGLVKLMKYIIMMTFGIEMMGAILLSGQFIPEYGITKGIWYSVFHSISAFCNAGFDLIGDSFISYSSSLPTISTLSLLIVLGGLGFSVIIDTGKNRNWKKFSLHTKLVLVLSIALTVMGAIIFLVLEYNNPSTIGSLPLGEKILSSIFASVVPRTAGFNSIDVAAMEQSSAFLTIILMFIGGSPGSTAGGIKTATFGVIALATINFVKGEKEVEVFKRRISTEVIIKSLAIVTVGMVMIIFVSFILTITENKLFLDTLFEATSAFATVGLTRGITSDLTWIGKIIIVMTMYAGRVGPLTMAFAFGHRKKRRQYRYSEGHISVG